MRRAYCNGLLHTTAHYCKGVAPACTRSRTEKLPHTGLNTSKIFMRPYCVAALTQRCRSDAARILQWVAAHNCTLLQGCRSRMHSLPDREAPSHRSQYIENFYETLLCCCLDTTVPQRCGARTAMDCC